MRLTHSDFLVGDKVYFGRENGQRTLGIIKKKNPKRAIVQILEQRGLGKGSEAGSEWNVAYGAMQHAGSDAKSNAPVVQKEKLKYNPFDDRNEYFELILDCYNALSPENLTCDGEIRSYALINAKRSKIERRLKHLQLAIDCNVSEDEAYDWWQSKQEYGRTPPQQQSTY